MDRATVIAERFEVEEEVGAGGMGTVFRATDRLTGQLVAIKVMQSMAGGHLDRFTLEARVLAELSHPAIVRYVAHGTLPSGEPYLAMEWLDGEDLCTRLALRGLTLRQSVELTLRMLDALTVVHARGVVHRDIKPANIFLPGSEVARAKLLDFGLARLSARAATRTGTMLGTPGYLAPEQARGERDVDARADLFSLGCVLFECLTGTPPFTGEHAMAVLAKIILEAAPRVRELRSDVPASLDELVARMLAKDRASRPASAAAAQSELAAIVAHLPSADAGTRQSAPPPVLTTSEQRLVSVILVTTHGAAKLVSIESACSTMVTDAQSASHRAALAAAARAHGASIEPLAGGSAVVTLVLNAATATDHAARAARCVLALRAIAPQEPMALVTGWGDASARGTLGQLVDRAASLVRDAKTPTRAILLDEVTAGLLDVRFVMTDGDTGPTLHGEREQAEHPARLLLGRRTTSVGRDREIGLLRSVLEECISEPVARAVLVTAAAGMGKSRVASEFVGFARASTQADVWIGRGDPMRTGAPFGILSQVIRGAAGVRDGEPLTVRQEKLRARVARDVDSTKVARVSEFLGEMVGTPFGDEGNMQLQAARQNPMLMGDQMRRAWEDFLAACTHARPVLMILEDLHWGDLPSITLIDGALRNLGGRPWMVVSLARPEIHDAFPKIWAARGLLEINLPALTKKASERLVREVLGDDVEPDLVEQLVEQAGGNALFLEELVRAASGGERGGAPRTVLAMVQARLEALDGESRRLLRAASVFGGFFWLGGVATLLGEPRRSPRLTELLESLVSAEVITRRESSRFAREEEYQFQHALVRDAAHAMLTDEDRALGHRLAGEWLEHAGESEAMTLGEHFERGGDRRRAVGWYRRATEQALEGDDLVAAISRAERGIACADGDDEIGGLLALQALAHSWRGEWTACRRCSEEAAARLPTATAAWYRNLAMVARAAGRLGDAERVERLVELLLSRPEDSRGDAARVMASAEVATSLVVMGRANAAEVMLAAIEGAEHAERPADRAHVQKALAFRALVQGDVERARDLFLATVSSFEEAGDLRSACQQRVSAASVQMELGCYADAERDLRISISTGERMGLADVLSVSRATKGMVSALLGRLDEGRSLVEKVIEDAGRQGDARAATFARVYLALILELGGKLDEAEAVARTAISLTEPLPPTQAYALGALARILLSRGRPDDLAAALEGSSRGMAIVDSLDGLEEGDALLRLVHAEALAANGSTASAAVAIVSARDRLLARAGRIREPKLRESFLRDVSENARTLAVARTLVPTA